MERALLLLILFLNAPALVAAEPPQVASRSDVEGVPLPPEAMARLGSSRFWHAGFLQVLKFSPDNRTLFTGTGSHDALYAWDVATGRLRWRNEFGKPRDNEAHFGRDLAPSDITFIDSDVAVILADEQKVEFVVYFDRATGKERRRVRLSDNPKLERYQFSPDGAKVALAHEAELAVYETASGRRVFSHRLDTSISFGDILDFSPDGRTLAVADDKAAVHILRSDTGQLIRKVATERGRIRSLQFAPRGDTIVLRADFYPVLVLDAASGAIRHALEPAGSYSLESLVPTPDGKELLTGGRVYLPGMIRQVCIISWDLATGKELRRFDYSSGAHLAISPDGRLLAHGAAHWIELYDLRKKEWQPQSSAPAWGYRGFQQRPDGTWVCLGSGIDFYDDNGRFRGNVSPFPQFDSFGAYLSPDGTRLLRYRPRRPNELRWALETWDTVAQKPLAVFGQEVGAKPVNSIEQLSEAHNVLGFSADSNLLYTRPGHDKPVQAWDVASGNTAAVPRGLQTTGRPLAFSPDGRWAAVANHHPQPEGCDLQSVLQVVSLVDTVSGRVAATFDKVKPSAGATTFSPDSRMLAIAWDHSQDTTDRQPLASHDLVYLFEVPSVREIGRLRGPDKSVVHIAFAPDSRSIATASTNNTTRLWEVGSWGARHAYPGGPTVLGKVAYSRDGKVLAAKGADAPAYLWDVYGARTRTAPKADAATFDKAWTDLASLDAEVGFRAIRVLFAASGAAVELLSERLKSESPLTHAQISKLIADLDSSDFTTREQATKELSDVVDIAELTARDALGQSSSPEAKRRMEVILSHFSKPTPRGLRVTRGVEVLEVIGTERARLILAELGKPPRAALRMIPTWDFPERQARLLANS